MVVGICSDGILLPQPAHTSVQILPRFLESDPPLHQACSWHSADAISGAGDQNLVSPCSPRDVGNPKGWHHITDINEKLVVK